MPFFAVCDNRVNLLWRSQYIEYKITHNFVFGLLAALLAFL